MIFDNLKDLDKKAKINMYALLYKHKSRDNNFSIGLPENINTLSKKDYIDQIKNINNFEVKAFNPSNSGLNDGTCEKVEFSNIESQVENIFEILNKHGNYKKDNLIKIRQTNAYVCEMEYNSKVIYVFSCQDNTTEKILKDKHIFMAQEDEVKSIPNKKIFIYKSYIDFIIKKNNDKNNDENQVLIFNKRNFIKFFNYDEEIKKYVIDNKDIIDNWSFLNSAKFIKEKLQVKKYIKIYIKYFKIKII